MNSLNGKIGNILSDVKKRKPLIHQITNFVVMNDTANATLHVGALPVMAHAIEEVEEMVALSGALLLNPGTLTNDWLKSMHRAGHKANSLGIPIVLDPVGAGATKFRTNENIKLLKKLKIAVLRGNAGEIGALAGAGGKVRGVESVGGLDNPAEVAKNAALKYKTTVAISGKRDYISDGKKVFGVDNGHELLTTITGTGCMSTALVAAFVSVHKDFLLATAAALAFMGLCGEIASKGAKGPASFKVGLLDAMYNLTPKQLTNGAKVIEIK